jgi:Na+/proline symporter
MDGVITIVVFMAIVVAIAAGILFVLDRLSLRKDLQDEERRNLVRKRTKKWRRRWLIFYVSCAAIALVVNALNLNHESLRSRIGWSVPAAIVLIVFLLSTGRDEERDNEDGE